MTQQQKLDAIAQKMRAANLSSELQGSFLRAVSLAEGGDDGTIAETEIKPVASLPDIETLADYSSSGRQALGEAVMIKLNGGLGTSMGLEKAKSLLPVRNGLCFLELIAQQVMDLRTRHQSSLPLIFMNSFRTEADTLEKLGSIDNLDRGQADIPFSFLQNKVPKLEAHSFLPVSHPQDADLEWCPPGHGDIYIALKQSGILDQLLDTGYRYAFVSNADNLGASLDINLLGFFASEAIPFLMEVADRTVADKKGGHVASRADSEQLLLREVAQTREQDLSAFQNIDRHKYFNTNSIWLNLPALSEVLQQHENSIPLPIIVNRKTVDPTDQNSIPVIQLESAMGAAIEIFPGSQAVRVARNRFLPVKKTNDLLVLMSDLYRLDESGVIRRDSDQALPEIELDERYFKNIADFLSRFPNGSPSLAECTKLKVTGDVRFGAHVRLIGDVEITAGPGETLLIEDDTCLGE